MIRRYGEPVRTDKRYVLRPGAYAVVLGTGGVLLTFQEAPIPEFQLPGGGIDPGEAAPRALYREVLEETGWRISGPRRIGAFRRFTFMPEYDLWAEKICHVYLARATVRLGPPSEAGHTAHWVSPDLAIGLIANEGDRAFMERVLG